MLLNKAEFLLMNNPLRAFIQEKYELPILLGMSSKRNHDSALEIGCGNGAGTRLIKENYGPGKLIAIDLDENMVKLARKGSDEDTADFMVMDASSLGFPDNCFDVVFDFGIIHHIPNWRECVFEVKRILKGQGELIIEELAIESFSGFPGGLWRRILDHPYDDMFTFSEFKTFLEETGFEIRDLRISNPMGLLKHVSLVATLSESQSSGCSKRS